MLWVSSGSWVLVRILVWVICGLAMEVVDFGLDWLWVGDGGL